MKILIVEDEPKVQQMLRDYFETKGYAVSTSTTGQGALIILQTSLPEVMLLDLMLKDKVSGKEVLADVQRISPKTVVIVTTGLEEEASHQEVLRLGAIAVLKKPIRLEELDELLEKIAPLGPAKA